MKRLGPLGGGYADRMDRHFAPTELGIPAPPPPPAPVVPKLWGPYVPPRRVHPQYLRILTLGVLCAALCYWLRLVWVSALYFGAYPY